MRHRNMGLGWLALSALLATGCGQGQAGPTAPPPLPVAVAEVLQKDVPVYAEWIASTDGAVNATIRAQVQGYLVSQRYREGDLVEKGQLLFEIDARPFQATLSHAEATLSQPDPRHRRGVRHPVRTVVALAVCAAVAGARSFTAIAQWSQGLSADALRRLGATRRTPPSEPTIRRVLQAVDADALDARLGPWLLQVAARPGAALSVDGKTLRGSHGRGQAPPHLLSAILHQDAVVVAQAAVPATTNEIPTLPALLAPLPLAGTVVTADALHTQAATARFLVEAKRADYVFTVKDNQATLRDDIAALRLDAFPPQATTTEKGHGRVETRALWASTALNAYLTFPHVGQVFCLRRTTTLLLTGTTRIETVYGVTSLPPVQASPARLLALVRAHWTIENRLHWVRDVTFDEDRSQVRRGAGPQVMATVRNLAISLLRLAGAPLIAPALRHAGWAGQALFFRLLGIELDATPSRL